jgi:hypothetical protein
VATSAPEQAPRHTRDTAARDAAPAQAGTLVVAAHAPEPVQETHIVERAMPSRVILSRTVATDPLHQVPSVLLVSGLMCMGWDGSDFKDGIWSILG